MSRIAGRMRPAGELGDDGPDRVEAVRPREQRLARLPLGDLRLQRGPFGLGDVGEVGDDQVELARPGPSRQKPDPGREAERLGVGPGDIERGRRGVGRGDLAARQLVGDRERDRARAGADVEHRLPAAARAPARPAARSPAAEPAPAGRPRARSSGTPCGRGCRRPARGAAAAAPSRRSSSRRTPGPRAPGSAASVARSHPVASESISSASRRGRLDPGRGEGVDRGFERLADPARGPGPGHGLRRSRWRPRGAVASPRRRAPR